MGSALEQTQVLILQAIKSKSLKLQLVSPDYNELVHFYKDDIWVIGNISGLLPGDLFQVINGDSISLYWKSTGLLFSKGFYYEYLDKNDIPYDSLESYKIATNDFFVNALSSGGGGDIEETDPVFQQWLETDPIPENVISITYSDLCTLLQNSELTVGQRYLITDYQTVHTIPNTTATNTGQIEPLLVTALSTNKIANECYSTLFPQDIIYYSLYADVNEFPDAVKGWIYRRIDTYKNVDMPYDFRNVKFRRWKVSAPEYSSTKLYAARDVCMNNNILYVSVNNNNINQSLTNRDYFYPLGMPNEGYIGLTSSSSASPKVAGLSFTIDANDYRDYFTFERYDLTQNVYQEIPTGLETASEKRLDWCNNIFFLNTSSLRIGQRVSGNTFMKMCNNVNLQLASFYNLFVGTFTNCFDITHFRYMWVDGGFNMNVCPYEVSYSVIVPDPAVSGTTPAIGWSSFGYVNNSFLSVIAGLNEFGDLRDSNLTGELYYNKSSFGLSRLKLHNVRKANFGAGVAAITLKNSTQGVNISAGATDINFPDGVKEINVMALGTLGLDLSQINFASYNSKDISNTTKTIESVSSTKVKLIYSDPNDGSISFVLLEKAIKSYTSITAPTFNNTNKTYTIPTLEGIEYYVDNVLKTAGTYSVNPGTLVFIEAKPITNYSIRHKVLKMWQYQMT